MNNQFQYNSTHLQWLDCTKAIGIIGVIMLHTFGGMILKINLSFIMPMFFMINGYTFRTSSSLRLAFTRAKRSSIKLLIPAVLTYMFLAISLNYNAIDVIASLLFQRCEDLVFSSYTIRGVGLIWFLSALFSAQIIYDILHLYILKKYLPFVIIVVSIIGVAMGYIGCWLPLNLDIAFAMQIFIYAGNICREYVKEKTTTQRTLIITSCKYTLLYCTSFIITCLITKQYLNIPAGIYPAFPICFITAIAGSLSIFLWSNLIECISSLAKPLSFVGSISLYIYCVHSIDLLFISVWRFATSITLQFISRLTFDIIVAIILSIIIQFISRPKVSNE